MMLRGLSLHARARGVPVVAVMTAMVLALSVRMATGVINQPLVHDGRVPMAFAAALLLAIVLPISLTSRDVWFDRSLPTPWRTWRAAHVLSFLLPAAALGVATWLGRLWSSGGAPVPASEGQWQVALAAVGLTGVCVLGQVVARPMTAWVLTVLSAFAVALAWPYPHHVAMGLLAALVFATATAAFAWRGPTLPSNS